MQNRPFKTPISALILHFVITVIMVVAPPAGDAFSLVVSLASYPTAILYALITIGLVKIRLSKHEKFSSPYLWFSNTACRWSKQSLVTDQKLLGSILSLLE